MPAQDKETPASSGIVLDETTGQRHVPSSTRADGTKRREIRIRPGYQPPEDVKVYRNRSAAAWQTRGKGGVPGAEGLATGDNNQSVNTASNKNAKRREAKKKAKAEEQPEEDEKQTEAADAEVAEQALDPDAEKEKKARNLKKKLRQARDLREKKDKGESLLPEQLAKIIKINELIRELDSLGFDGDGESKSNA
jgi:partner of Y14 and mago protein